MEESRAKDLNIWLMSIGFFLSFIAFYSMGNIQTIILENAKDPESEGYIHGFDGDGFISLMIVYSVSALSDWLGPSVRALFGLKMSMVLGSFTYALFIASFYSLSEVLLYLASAILGAGHALVFICQGVFLSLNSTKETMARNTGIFWVMFQGAGLVGNTVSYFQFGDSHDIDPNTRNVFVTVLLVVSCAGALVHCFTLPMPWTSTIEGDKPDTVVTAITRSAKLFSTRPMLQLMVYFIFHGMEYAFWTGVYGPCLGFTLNFYKSRRLPGLHGIIDATGQIIAGLMCIFFGTRIIQRHGRWPVVLLGLLCLFSAYILIFFNLPKEAPFGDTEAPAIIEPSSVGIALFCSLLLGFGSGCLATQTIALVGTIYQDQSAQGYVSYKFLSHGGIAIGFAYAGFLNLYWQLGILWAMGTLGFLLFYLTEAEYRREHMDSLQEDG